MTQHSSDTLPFARQMDNVLWHANECENIKLRIPLVWRRESPGFTLSSATQIRITWMTTTIVHLISWLIYGNAMHRNRNALSWTLSEYLDVH